MPTYSELPRPDPDAPPKAAIYGTFGVLPVRYVQETDRRYGTKLFVYALAASWDGDDQEAAHLLEGALRYLRFRELLPLTEMKKDTL